MTDFKPGLEGVVAFETEIAEPDRDGGALRYRGVDIEELVGSVPFEQVWGLLVDESLQPGLPYEHVDLERRTGGFTADLQVGLSVQEIGDPSAKQRMLFQYQDSRDDRSSWNAHVSLRGLWDVGQLLPVNTC